MTYLREEVTFVLGEIHLGFVAADGGEFFDFAHDFLRDEDSDFTTEAADVEYLID